MVTPGGRLLVDGEPIEDSHDERDDGTMDRRASPSDEAGLLRDRARSAPTTACWCSASPQYTHRPPHGSCPRRFRSQKPGRDLPCDSGHGRGLHRDAKADDDYGISEHPLLVYLGERWGPEDTVTSLFEGQRGAPLPEVTAGHTLLSWRSSSFEPGDIVSYYGIARDNRVGSARSREVKSDIYFIQVRPFRDRLTARATRPVNRPEAGVAGAARKKTALSNTPEATMIAATFNIDPGHRVRTPPTRTART